MYHSAAVLVRDGGVLVGGSNPHKQYNFTNVLYPSELRLEAFSPSYLDPSSSGLRPKILLSTAHIQYGKRMVIRFMVGTQLDMKSVLVTVVAPSFNTHSFSMNQRLFVLDRDNITKVDAKWSYEVGVVAPPSSNVAPAGYYLLFLVHKNIPSEGVWIHVE